PEGTNIGLIASLSIYAGVDDYGFLITPYRVVENGKVNGEHKYLRADEEMKAVLAPPEVASPDSGKVRQDLLLARVNGDLQQVRGSEINYVDISPKQTVAISAA
ncbi:DNA-directed RNA polymerase subunit B, partial [mine drainage metagenome]